jgi:hypothetical protein
MTREELDNLSPGDSIIGLSEDDEHEVLAVTRPTRQCIAHVRYMGAAIPVRLLANGPEIRGARRC